MPKNKFFTYLICNIVAATFSLSHANEISISNASSAWEADENTRLSNSSGALAAKSLASNTWLSPESTFDYEPDTSLNIEYQLRSGNIIIQANWFDANGNYIETTKLGTDTSENNTASFPVVKPETGESLETYRIKIWLEAELPSFELKSLSINKAAAPTNQPLFMAKEDFEPAEGIDVKVLRDGSVELELTENSATKSIHTEKRYNIQRGEKLDVSLSEISMDTSFSMQILFWDAAGTYLSHLDVIKDATDPVIIQTFSTSSGPKGGSAYSIKFWLSGHDGSVAKVQVMQSR